MGSKVVVHQLSCSMACRIFLDQGSNPCPLHWQVDSLPLSHQGSPRTSFEVMDLKFQFYLLLTVKFWKNYFPGESQSEVAQSCPTLHDPMDCSLPGSSIHGTIQARVLEWGAIAFSKQIWTTIYKTENRKVLLESTGNYIQYLVIT